MSAKGRRSSRKGRRAAAPRPGERGAGRVRAARCASRAGCTTASHDVTRPDRRSGPPRAAGPAPRDAVLRAARHGVFALVLGAVLALVAGVLTLAIRWASGLPQRFPWLPLALPVLGVASIGLFRLLRLPLAAQPGSVVDEVRADEQVPAALAPAALVATCLTVVGGGSVGMTATGLAMGASVASGLGRLMRLRPLVETSRRPGVAEGRGWTAACGMAAAFSALFAAPLAAVAFALELVRFDGEVVRHAPALLLASLAAVLAAAPLHAGYALPRAAMPAFSWEAVATCIFVGLACATAGFLFAASLNGLRRLLYAGRVHPAVVAAAGGALVAALVLGFGWQRFEGSGLALMSDAFAGRAGAFDFAAKALLTVAVLGFGFKGGEVVPSFAVGSALGASCAGLIGAEVPFAAACGMAAFFAAVTRCPLAALLLAVETFGWAAAPWAAIAVAGAYAGSADVGTHGRGAVSFAARSLRARRYRALKRER